MTVVSFPHRSPEPARTLTALVASKRSPDPICDVTVTKDVRERRYVIWSDAPGHWVGEVWFGRAQRRHKAVFGVHDVRMMGLQFARELRDLITDGWTELHGS